MKKLIISTISILFLVALSFGEIFTINNNYKKLINLIYSDTNKDESDDYIVLNFLLEDLLEIDIYSKTSDNKEMSIYNDFSKDIGLSGISQKDNTGNYQHYMAYMIEGGQAYGGPPDANDFYNYSYFFGNDEESIPHHLFPLIKFAGDGKYSKIATIKSFENITSQSGDVNNSEKITFNATPSIDEWGDESNGPYNRDDVIPMKIDLLDLDGQLISTSINDAAINGENTVEFDNLKNGNYENVRLALNGYDDRMTSEPFSFSVENISSNIWFIVLMSIIVIFILIVLMILIFIAFKFQNKKR